MMKLMVVVGVEGECVCEVEMGREEVGSARFKYAGAEVTLPAD
jgi:hypothetical protein